MTYEPRVGRRLGEGVWNKSVRDDVRVSLDADGQRLRERKLWTVGGTRAKMSLDHFLRMRNDLYVRNDLFHHFPPVSLSTISESISHTRPSNG